MTVTDPYSEPPPPQGPYPPQQQPQGPYPTHQLPPGPPVSPAPYGQPPQVSYIVKAPTSTMAVTSMILSIVGFLSMCCSFGVPSILAVIFGHIALKETANNQKEGHGMAVAGLILGYIGVLPALFFSISWFVGVATGYHPTPSTTP